jgi:hypothetical protein
VRAVSDFETLVDAIVDAVKALGGSKCVGPMLWPEKTPEAAQRLILACLNDARPEHLTPDQMLFIAKLARARGNHSIMTHLAQETGYAAPQPVEPEDEKAELMRQFNASVELMDSVAQRLEKFGLSPIKRAV